MNKATPNTHWRGAARDNDAFYTIAKTAQQCVAIATPFIVEAAAKASSTVVIMEPAAGDGAFVDALAAAGFSNVRASDLAPARADILQKDFLETSRDADDGNVEYIVITNPPFGHCASQAIKFFNHAATVLHASAIAMVVPASFRRPTIAARLRDVVSQRYVLRSDTVLPSNSFRFRSDADSAYKVCDVPTLFMVWTRNDDNDDDAPPQPIQLLAQPPHQQPVFEFVRFSNTVAATTTTFCDVAIQRVGRSAGRVVTDRDYILSKRHGRTFYFIVFLNDDVRTRVLANGGASALSEYLQTLPCMKENAGISSISKPDLTTAVSQFFASTSSS